MNTFIEIPANQKSFSMRKPVHGIGINDADYIVCPRSAGKMSMCPYYKVWKSMIERCHSDKFQAIWPTYIGCTVSSEWLTFSIFKCWMIKQDWQGKELDKDILIPGNKVYGAESCTFVSHPINNLLTDSAATRGDLPQGVTFHNRDEKYRSQCSVNGIVKHLGYFSEINKAEKAYLEFKSSYVIEVSIAEDEPLRSALVRHADKFKERAAQL